jgi:UDP-N-acetylglucosamine 2-epimerase (non-hydrolysing)
MVVKLLLTASSGIQEECTILGSPCIMLRFIAEMPVTLRDNGRVNVLVKNITD